ncbi:MAG TPA: hypothetical protein VMI31_04370 [Fimbriimonadaceae bacterium]|nr:hypothetical protein [Fimbriimonadaceae bacterium]
MNTKTLATLAIASVSAAACAQLSSGIRIFGGYGWSGSISNTTTGSTHLLGPELGLEFPVSKIANTAETDIRADVLLGGQLAHGSDLDGYIYRFLWSARTAIPGSTASTFAGIGWGWGEARNGEFPSFNGFITQIGVDIPMGLGVGNLTPSLELSGSYGKSGLSGYSVCLAFKF